MLFTFGTGFYGKVANHNGHWIETKCFHIMFVPLIPVSSMYVTDAEFRKRHGFDIPLDTQSIIAIYARLFTGLLAAYMLFLIFSGDLNLMWAGTSIYVIIAIAILSITAWVYFCFYYGKASPDDIAMRKKVKTVTGMYALPHWFDHAYLWKMLEAYQKKYREEYPGRNWKIDLDKEDWDMYRSRMLYGIALFNCMVNNSPENDELYFKADNLYS